MTNWLVVCVGRCWRSPARHSHKHRLRQPVFVCLCECARQPPLPHCAYAYVYWNVRTLWHAITVASFVVVHKREPKNQEEAHHTKPKEVNVSVNVRRMTSGRWHTWINCLTIWCVFACVNDNEYKCIYVFRLEHDKCGRDALLQRVSMARILIHRLSSSNCLNWNSNHILMSYCL